MLEEWLGRLFRLEQALVPASVAEIMARYHQGMASFAHSTADTMKHDALFKQVVVLCRFSKNTYFKTRKELEARTVDLQKAREGGGHIPEAEAAEMHYTLADVRGKRDEVADDRDLLRKEHEAEWAATEWLKAAHTTKLERLTGALQKEAPTKEDASRVLGVSG